VLTDHPEPYLYILSPKVTPSGELSLVSESQAISLQERIGRPAEFFAGLVVDPTERIVVVSVYTGKLRVIDFRSNDPGDGFDVKYV
jgi:DNA damage-binding protein 1